MASNHDVERHLLRKRPLLPESTRVTTRHGRRVCFRSAVSVLAMLGALAFARAQSTESAKRPTSKVWGYVRDSGGKPLANASVTLQAASDGQTVAASPVKNTRTDYDGVYQFLTLDAGAYTVRARADRYPDAITGAVSLAENETKRIDLTLVSSTSGAQSAGPSTPVAAKREAQAPEFFDEPQFTVAGVTQATNAGGHGSDTALRTTEALARATTSLGKESGRGSDAPTAAETEGSLRDAISRTPDDAALHHRLGDLEEKLGNPLEAVRQYQRAAELDPSEPNLFDWGAELLTHRALEPASEVFTRGNRLFPKSVRMLVALGVTWYARDSYDRATQCLENASDLAPENATPYLFLGRILSVETTPSKGPVEKLARFAELQPNSPFANYYYAVALAKQSANEGDVRGDRDAARSANVESLLEKAVHLDPNFGAAYLQLGILYSRRTDFDRAISNYRKAIENGPEGGETQIEAHYRLGQTYLRTGDKAQAKQELEVHDKLAKKNKEDTERERREVQEFIISLRGKASPTTQP